MISNLVLGDSLEVLIDHRGKTPKKLGTNFVDAGVPVASAILVKNGRLDLSEARFVDEATWRRWMGVPTRIGDVLLTSEAPLGRVARVETDEPLVLGQRLYGLRGEPGVLDSGYLFYALQTDQVQADLLGRSTGTTVFGIRQSALRKVVIPAPPFEEQRAIAEVLGALDDKIAANDRVIRTADGLCAALVAQATANGPRARLRDLMILHYGKSLPAAQRRSGSVTVVGSGGPTGTHDTPLVDRPGVVLGRKGTVGAVHWCDSLHYPIDTTYYVEPLGELSSEVLFYMLRSMPLSELNSDSAVPGLNREETYAQLTRSPTSPRLLTMELHPKFHLMATVRRESDLLAATRDELLPQLMSGKIRVKDAEKATEGVL